MPLIDGLQYMRFFRWLSGYRAAGDIHGVAAHTVPEIRRSLSDKFGCGILVREPVARLHSALSLFSQRSHTRAWNVDYVHRFLDNGVNIPKDIYENRLVLHGINSLNNIETENKIAPVWRQEDLTSDAVVLARFVYDLTGIEIAADSDWIRAAIGMPRVNAHAQSPAKFEDWVLEAMRKIVRPRAWELYAELGYPTPSFVTL